MVKLSILIVNYKNQNLIIECVKSIIKYEKKLDYEIIVIDNNSEDDSEKKLREIYPYFNWIQMGYNSGFGRANNRGIKEAKGENILLLNSDIIINKPNILQKSLEFYFKLPSYKNTVLGIRLTNPDGSYQPTLRLDYYGIQKEIEVNPLYIYNTEKRLNKKLLEREYQKEMHYHSGYVSWINGAFLMFHKSSILNKSLFFDKDFFLYGEDNEWCWRASKNGLKFYHWHEPEIIHIGSASMPNNIKRRAQITVSQWLLILKTRNAFYYLALLMVVICNLIFDGILHFQHRLRNKTITEYHIVESNFRKVYWYLLFKYGFRILFKKQLSNTTSFYTNCYEDKHI